MKCAVVTGASRGIGRAISKALADEGCYPLLCLTSCKSPQLLAELSDEIMAVHPEQSVFCISGDIGDPAFVEKLQRDLSSSGGSVSLLINNAGIAGYGLLSELSPEEWDRMIRTNLTGVYNTCRVFQPELLRSGEGRIINISSVWGAVGASCEAAYSAAKGGIDAFTKALAKELAPSHVAVNSIQLGAVDTDMNRHLDPEEKSALEAEIPFGRFATPEEAARIVILMKNMPLYVTGAVLKADGGWI